MSNPRKHTSKIRQRLEVSGDKVRRARLPKRMRIALKIADAIDALDWGNKDLAERLGKYQSQITKWLKGDHNFTIDTLSDIEEILGIRLLALDEPAASSTTKIEVTLNITSNMAELMDKNHFGIQNYIANAGGLQSSLREFKLELNNGE